MWKVDLIERTAEHDSGFTLLSEAGGIFKIIAGDNSALLEEGKKWFLHEYSKNYINSVREKFDLTLYEIARITQKEINEKPMDDWGFKSITEEDLLKYIKDEEPLFPIELCSFIRKAIYFQVIRRK